LGPYSGRLPREVSRGMRQRLALARALLHDPVILLLDEPFAGLDREGREWLTDLLRDLRNRGRTICFTTHEGKSAAGLADRWVTLQSGRLQRAPGSLCCERTPSERVGSGRAA
ncbi:MAG: ATP-binding cassette domain-containing protein, partial [Planctomycetes bacterium]|nr:ATP-binding cassette domain-containing protein [Planctomycetota bacterium]